MIKPYLTKSRFKLALDCETKLFYTSDENYCNRKLDNPFLEALAEGGFQVGELAKLYHYGGIEISDWDYESSLARTNELLKRENVTLFEAAVKFENCFIRIDILEKMGNHLNLIEVKAKSFDGMDEFDFQLKKSEGISIGWKEYLYDVAFQKFVLKKAFPEYQVSSYLMLCDKNAKATVDGLNQMFLINRDRKVDKNKINREFESLKDTEKLGTPVLRKVSVDCTIEKFILQADIQSEGLGLTNFENWIEHLSSNYISNKKIKIPIGSKCDKCEFNYSKDPVEKAKEKENKKLSGFEECFKEQLKWTNRDFEKARIFELWNYRNKDEAIKDKKYFLADFSETDFEIGNDDFSEKREEPLTIQERQWLQILKSKNKDNSPVILKEGLRNQMENLVYPLHFIDFETTMVAMPFYKGLSPYEGVAFQFSHHMAHKNGFIEHKGEYINIIPGKFPNFEFVRRLKSELDKDDGSIFRYSNHENTYLTIIYRHLENSFPKEVPDREDLMNFIKIITRSTKSTPKEKQWEGERNMIDLWQMGKQFYYSPLTKGSNSIKYVLPAILNHSLYLQQKYSKPIYGTSVIPSKNYTDYIWIRTDKQGKVIDPYKLLEPLFEGYNNDLLDTFLSDPESEIKEGGAAMMTYAKMQFTEMSGTEREILSKGLLKYCELDTFAMVLIWEYWKNECDK